MRSVLSVVLAALLSSSTACRRGAVAPEPALDEALLLVNGRIWTGDPQQPWAEAVATLGDRILAVGTGEQVRQAMARAGGPPTRTVELSGRLVMPGFIDAHLHILGAGLALERIDLGGLSRREELVEAIGSWAQRHPEDPWILGRGWSYGAFRPGLPTRQELDSVVRDRPVYVRSYDGHTGWANTRALEAAGIGAHTLDPPDGTIVREPGTRVPSGALLEGAMSLIAAKVPPPDDDEKQAAIRRALSLAASYGLTTVCDVGGALKDLQQFRRLDEEHALPIRVVYGPAIEEGMEDYARERLQLIQRRTATSRLYPGPLKGFVDGVIEANTASLLGPYADGSGEGTQRYYTAAALRQQVAQAHRLGLDVAFHAVGDAAVRSVLDAVEQSAAAAQGRRPRIEHIELIHESDLPRFAKLGVVASVMPLHAEPGDEPTGGVWSTKVGPARLPTAFAFRSLQEAGAHLAFGSDWPVASPNPLLGVAIAATRQGADGKPPGGWIPAQRLGVEAALAAYTRGSAYAVGLDEAGELKAGKLADLVVLSPDVSIQEPASFFHGKVELTVVGGRVVFERARRSGARALAP